MSPFNIGIPRKDHCMTVRVETCEQEPKRTFNLFYNDQLTGCMFDNENGIWIYEPHGHEALILDAEEIQQLGKHILEHAN